MSTAVFLVSARWKLTVNEWAYGVLVVGANSLMLSPVVGVIGYAGDSGKVGGPRSDVFL